MSLISNSVLLFWFFLDMTGVKLGEVTLVTRAYREDGIFFLIFAVSIIFFWKWEKTGKYILSGWLLLWFITQFISHWYFTIFGPWEEKINFFAETLKLIPTSERYIPDLYHVILHVLILLALILTIRCLRATKEQK